jgi:uncharacterized protein (TIGR02284 family)
MSTAQDHDIKSLNKLIAVILDSAHEYEMAAETAMDAAERHRLEDRAIERRRVKMVLQDMVRLLGAEPTESGTMMAAASRTMQKMKDSLSGDGAGQNALDATEDRLHGELIAASQDQELTPQVRDAVIQALHSIEADGTAPPPPLAESGMAAR